MSNRPKNNPYTRFNNDPATNKKSILEMMYTRVLTELCVNRFHWSGMPDSIDTRFLELMLFNQALSVFYFDGEYERYFALRATGVGKINMYDNPTSFTVVGNQFHGKTLPGNKCVPIWSNYLRIPDIDIVRIYAARLAEIDRTIEIKTLNSRNPVVIAVTKDERLSLQNAFRQVQEGQPVIFGTENFSPTELSDKMQVLNMGQERGDLLDMMTVKARTWNECMTLLGIENANTDKKERMITDEVSANEGQVLASRAVSLNARRIAAQQINDMYNLSVSVDWNLDSKPFEMGV